jgi:hypothetical protein
VLDTSPHRITRVREKRSEPQPQRRIGVVLPGYPLGYVLAAIAAFMLLISAGALIQSFATGRFSSGVPYAPTIVAIAGVLAGGWPWTLFAIVVSLDLGGYLLARARPRTPK